MACQVCCEELNRSSHNPCECPKCNFIACKTCVRTYLESTPEEFHCMSCKYAWDDEFVVLAVNKTYFHGDLKEKKKQKYFEIEKSKLAASQLAAKQLLIEEAAKIEVDKLKEANAAYRKLIRENEKIIQDIEYQIKHKVKKEQKAFIMRCQASDCNGFVSKSYKCELCEKTTCSKCFEIVVEGHVCNEDNVQTAELIKKDSRPCPKCATRISKIDGCNQMWCTSCNTAFDWISGLEVKGQNIHNPHYYEYLKTAGNGIVPRNPGDVLCGGLPDLAIINTALIGANPDAVSFIRHNVYAMHRFIGHVNQYLRPVNIQEFETALEHARVLHILNRTNEEKFKQSVFTIYNKKTKKNVNIRLLELVQTVGMDLLQNYIKIYGGIGHKPTDVYVEKTKEIVKEFHTIIEYFNTLQEKKTKLFKESGVRIKIENSTRASVKGLLFNYNMIGYP